MHTSSKRHSPWKVVVPIQYFDSLSFWRVVIVWGFLTALLKDTLRVQTPTLSTRETKPWRKMLESALLYLCWRSWKYAGQRRKLVFSTTPSRQKASLSVCFVILSTIDFGLRGAEDRSRHHHKTNVFFSEHESVFFCTSFYLHFLLHCVFRIGMNVAQKWGEKATQWDSPIKIILLSPPKTLHIPLPYETTESGWSTKKDLWWFQFAHWWTRCKF